LVVSPGTDWSRLGDRTGNLRAEAWKEKKSKVRSVGVESGRLAGFRVGLWLLVSSCRHKNFSYVRWPVVDDLLCGGEMCKVSL
jgi:hypothetical protein